MPGNCSRQRRCWVSLFSWSLPLPHSLAAASVSRDGIEGWGQREHKSHRSSHCLALFLICHWCPPLILLSAWHPHTEKSSQVTSHLSFQIHVQWPKPHNFLLGNHLAWGSGSSHTTLLKQRKTQLKSGRPSHPVPLSMFWPHKLLYSVPAFSHL